MIFALSMLKDLSTWCISCDVTGVLYIWTYFDITLFNIAEHQSVSAWRGSAVGEAYSYNASMVSLCFSHFLISSGLTIFVKSETQFF